MLIRETREFRPKDSTKPCPSQKRLQNDKCPEYQYQTRKVTQSFKGKFGVYESNGFPIDFNNDLKLND